MNASINGISLYYEVHGQGVPVLCIHGFPLSGRLWTPIIGALSDRYELIIPDLRGLGRSEVSEEASMGDYADDLAGLLDAVGTQTAPVVVGLSMGGYIAFEFYRRYPQRVRALVFADTRAHADTEEAARTRAETAQRVLREGSHVVAQAMLDKLFAPNASPQLRNTWRDIMADSDPKGVAAALKAMAHRLDSTPTLETIDVPTLVIVGENDTLTPLADARRIHEGIAGSRLEVIPEAGHMTPVETPTRFAQVFRTFLDSIL